MELSSILLNIAVIRDTNRFVSWETTSTSGKTNIIFKFKYQISGKLV